MANSDLRAHLAAGVVIPAHPLALTAERRLDEQRQRALTRYYLDAGAGGIAVGVHTTQFEIRDPRHGLLRPVLELARETVASWGSESASNGGGAVSAADNPFVLIAGAIGETKQAVAEASLARYLGYDMVLLSLGALKNASDEELLMHCRVVSEVLPLFGFYLQPAVGGRVLGYEFWRAFAEIEHVHAIKIAPFNRYQTLDVVRAVMDAGRDDIALYTGNDDSIIVDLLTPFPGESAATRRLVGGLLGQWAVWTRTAVGMLDRAHASGAQLEASWLRDAAALTDANSAIFDAAHQYVGCIAGIHEILRRQGLLRGTWCLDPHEGLSAGQAEEIDRVCRWYPELNDDEFVRANLDRWLA